MTDIIRANELKSKVEKIISYVKYNDKIDVAIYVDEIDELYSEIYVDEMNIYLCHSNISDAETFLHRIIIEIEEFHDLNYDKLFEKDDYTFAISHDYSYYDIVRARLEELSYQEDVSNVVTFHDANMSIYNFYRDMLHEHKDYVLFFDMYKMSKMKDSELFELMTEIMTDLSQKLKINM